MSASTAVQLSKLRAVEQAQQSLEIAAAAGGRRSGQQSCRQMGVGSWQGRPARFRRAALYPRTETRLGRQRESVQRLKCWGEKARPIPASTAMAERWNGKTVRQQGRETRAGAH